MSREIHIVADDPVLGSDTEWEAALLAVEKSGCAITVSGSTDRRELARRAVRDVETGNLASNEAEFLLVSVNPDWVDDMGHHAHFDRALGKAVQSSGGLMVSLTSASLPPQQSGTRAIFSHPTFGYGTSQAAIFSATFERELRSAIERLAGEFEGIPIRVAMYSAGIPQLSAIVSVAAAINDPRITFHVNLLRAHNELLDMQQESGPSLASLTLQAALDVGPTVGVHTMADTDEIGDMLESLFGHHLSAWPMIGVTDLDDDPEIRPPTTPPTACYPATQEIKGLPLFTELAERVAAGASQAPVRFIARDTGHHLEWTSRLAAAGVELHSGILTPAEYARFMESSDIILLPYRSRPFQIQTSGVFADAVRLRKPVVATRSTWAGRLITEHGIGTTFEESDLEGFTNALTEVIENFDQYQQRMIDFAPRWLRDNNPESLLDAFVRVDAEHATRRPDSSGIELLAALTRVTARETERIAEAQALSADHFEQVVADLAATAEKLEMKLATRDRAIERLEMKLATRDRAIERLEHRIATTRADRDKRLSIQREEIDQRDRELHTLWQKLDQRQARIDRLLADYARTKTNLETRIETREETIRSLQEAIANRDDDLASVKERYEQRIGVLKKGVEKRDQELATLNSRFSVRVGKAIRRATGRGK